MGLSILIMGYLVLNAEASEPLHLFYNFIRPAPFDPTKSATFDDNPVW